MVEAIPNRSATRSSTGIGSPSSIGTGSPLRSSTALAKRGSTRRWSPRSRESRTRSAAHCGRRIGRSAGTRVRTPSNMPVSM